MNSNCLVYARPDGIRFKEVPSVFGPVDTYWYGDDEPDDDVLMKLLDDGLNKKTKSRDPDRLVRETMERQEKRKKRELMAKLAANRSD